MTQLPPIDSPAIAQLKLEQYINQQAFLIAIESGASYSIKSQNKNL